ncbi:MAG TPA: hypothetical protein PLB14_09465, partial [Smithellaceae bacterium]|nr:hypothetical protein [Smithellaceae bacterium]
AAGGSEKAGSGVKAPSTGSVREPLAPIISIYTMFIIRIYIRPEGKAMQKVFTQTLNLITQGLYLDT